MTKAMVMASAMDDIYDVHGTYEELELFTNAIERSAVYMFTSLQLTYSMPSNT